MEIIPMQASHWEHVKEIYEEGIATGHATFETSAPTWAEWDSGHIKHSRFVAVVDGKIAGWAALSAVSGRCVYAGVAEVSIYVGEKFRGRGIGKKLLQELIASSEKHGLWTLTAGIFLENKGSIKLHEACEFERLGIRKKLGQLKGVWKDTVLMERRSEVVGV